MVLALSSALVVGLGLVGLSRWREVTAPSRGVQDALQQQGGIVLVLEARAGAGETMTAEVVDRIAQVLRDRIDALGIGSSEIVASGLGATTTFTLTLVGARDADAARALVHQGALELRPVVALDLGTRGGSSGLAVVPPRASTQDDAALRADYAAARCAPSTGAPPVADQEPSSWLIACSADGTLKYLLGPAALTGDGVRSATVVEPTAGADYALDIVFEDRSAQALADVSTRLAAAEPPANQLAIVLDSVVQSSPYVPEPILQGSVQITGEFTAVEAQELADRIEHGRLPMPLEVSEVRIVPRPA